MQGLEYKKHNDRQISCTATENETILDLQDAREQLATLSTATSFDSIVDSENI